MQNPIGLLICSDLNQKYFRIEIYKGSQITFGLNEYGAFEIQKDMIRFYLAILEHKFNSFQIQTLSDCLHYRGKYVARDSLIILDENDTFQFQYQQQIWEYLLVFVRPNKSKTKDSKMKTMIQVQQLDNYFLDNSLKCAICLEIFQRPVQLQQCKHCFCGYCVTILKNNSLRCPTCRTEFTQVTNVKVLDKLAQTYLRKYPEKAKTIQEQQLYEQENIYYYQYETTYCKRQDNNEQIDQQIDESADESDNEQIDESDLSELDEILSQDQPQCYSCQNQYKDYICQPDQQHLQCCNYLLPKRELNTRENAQYKLFCQVCKKYTCKFYYDTACPSDIDYLLRWCQMMNYLANLFLQEQLINRIQQYLKGLPIDYLFTFVIKNSVRLEQFYLEGYQKFEVINENELLLEGSPVCSECMFEVLPQMVIKFFEFNRMNVGIPSCVNGIHCQQQYEDESHNMNYNHLCRRQV